MTLKNKGKIIFIVVFLMACNSLFGQMLSTIPEKVWLRQAPEYKSAVIESLFSIITLSSTPKELKYHIKSKDNFYSSEGIVTFDVPPQKVTLGETIILRLKGTLNGDPRAVGSFFPEYSIWDRTIEEGDSYFLESIPGSDEDLSQDFGVIPDTELNSPKPFENSVSASWGQSYKISNATQDEFTLILSGFEEAYIKWKYTLVDRKLDDGLLSLGGETVTPPFGTLLMNITHGNVNVQNEVKQELADLFAAGNLSKETISATIGSYGNWVGESWWGGSRMPDKVGALPPIDALDALAQEHDFAYALAEEAGKLYGEAEKNRLLALADQNSYEAFKKLPKDPTEWNPRPKNIEEAIRYRDRFPLTMFMLGYQHERGRLNSEPPTQEQVERLEKRGKVSAKEFRTLALERVEKWKIDKGVSMRKANSRN